MFHVNKSMALIQSWPRKRPFCVSKILDSGKFGKMPDRLCKFVELVQRL